jgi:hypothetical protein
MQNHIQNLQESLQPYRHELIKHPLFNALKSLEDVQIFMQHHVYAVWDFMSLVKGLQQQLTCTTWPWFPRGRGDIRYLINEIVLGEESDVDDEGNRMSHYEMYLDAMKQCGSDISSIITFTYILSQTNSIERAFLTANTPESVQNFNRETMHLLQTGKIHELASAFTFGREELIPDLFPEVIHQLDSSFPGLLSKFRYYLLRHIEVDGGQHQHLAFQMTEHLCGNDPDLWKEAENIAIKALQMRKVLWDGIYEELMANKPSVI